jgi:hypothetical protein
MQTRQVIELNGVTILVWIFVYGNAAFPIGVWRCDCEFRLPIIFFTGDAASAAGKRASQTREYVTHYALPTICDGSREILREPS